MNLEEKRQIIDLEIEVITSAELGIGNEFGYDGTAIYLKTNDNIEELYIISQGSQDIKDWEYNAKSMLAGLNISQGECKINCVSKRAYGSYFAVYFFIGKLRITKLGSCF